MFLVIKLLHIASVVLFLGNITTGLLWHAITLRTRDPKLLAHVMGGIILSDRWLTVPSAALITLTGVASAMLSGLPLLRTPWIAGAIALLTLSGLLFSWRVAPLSKRLHDLASAGASSGAFDAAAYERVAKSWELWGIVATLAPVAAMALMVLKPGR